MFNIMNVGAMVYIVGNCAVGFQLITVIISVQWNGDTFCKLLITGLF